MDVVIDDYDYIPWNKKEKVLDLVINSKVEDLRLEGEELTKQMRNHATSLNRKIVN